MTTGAEHVVKDEDEAIALALARLGIASRDEVASVTVVSEDDAWAVRVTSAIRFEEGVIVPGTGVNCVVEAATGTVRTLGSGPLTGAIGLWREREAARKAL